MASLTPEQQILLQWIVKQYRSGRIAECFQMTLRGDGCYIHLSDGHSVDVLPHATRGAFTALSYERCLREELIDNNFGLWRYTVTGYAYELVDANFVEPAPTASQVTHYWQPTISSSTNVQVGPNNTMRIKVQVAAETIAEAIHSSAATPEQKEEAKGWWKKFWENPATKAVLEAGFKGAADTLSQ